MSKNMYEGMTYSEKYVTVAFKASYGGSVRFETVKIPWEALAKDLDFVEGLSNAVATILRNTWDMGQEDYPLF